MKNFEKVVPLGGTRVVAVAGCGSSGSGGGSSTQNLDARLSKLIDDNDLTASPDAQIADLIEFLKALTDPRMLETASLAPDTVPPGLPIDVPGEREFPIYQ